MALVSVHYNWGPLLYKGKLSSEDIKKILKICVKNKKWNAVSSLAANIKEEFFIDQKEFMNITEKYYHDYIKNFERYYDTAVPNINLETVWVNYMKAGESNPPHIHTNCNLSSVWFLKIPNKLKQENLKYKGTVVNGGPGSICFMHGAFSPMAIDEVRYFPEEGDFFIFPYNVKHYVSPFLSTCVRISVAANYTIDVTNEKQKTAGFFGSYEKK